MLTTNYETYVFEGYVYVKLPSGDFARQCGKCAGTGLYDAPTYVTDGRGRPFCFDCVGAGFTGKVHATLEDASKHATSLRKAQERRNAKRQAAAKERFERTKAEFEAEEAKRQAEAAAKAEAKAKFQHFGTVGEKTEVTGEVVVLKSIETQFGTSRLVILKVDEVTEVKMFTSAGWTWEVAVGDTVTLTAWVKSHDVWDDQKTTMLARPKMTARTES